MRIERRVFVRKLQQWLPPAFWALLFLYAVWPWMSWRDPPVRTLILYGFSILGDALNQTVFPVFQQNWDMTSGEHVEFISSFAGSGTVTNQLIMGVPAQVALLSHELDAQRLASSGVIAPGSWKHLPYEGIVNRTPFIILVRPGNPKKIRSFSDLARPGIKVVHPDPLTSGAANWAILAEYGAGVRESPNGSKEGGIALLRGIWRNVVAQAHSARAARSQFENGFGDALITYEQEVLWDRMHGRLKSEVVYPTSTIMSEHILVVIERNIDSEQWALVNSFINFLWSRQAQTLFTKSGFRSVDESVNALNPEFRKIKDPFTVRDLGGWERAKREIVDGIWKERVLKEVGQRR